MKDESLEIVKNKLKELKGISTTKQILISLSKELIFLKSILTLKGLYNEIKKDQDFIGEFTFYRYMKLITENEPELKNSDKYIKKETKPKEKHDDTKPIKNEDPLHFTEIEIDKKQLSLFKSALKNSEPLARQAIANGLSYEFVKSEFNSCTSIIQVTNKLNKIIEDIENGNK